MTQDKAPSPASHAEEPVAAGGSPGVSAEEFAALNEKWLRALADLDNLRKRMDALVEAAVVGERRTMLGGLIEVLDNVDCGLQAHSGEENEWVEGLKAIRRQMLELMRRFGAAPFKAAGEAFDPNLHEAMSQIACPDVPRGVVVEVLQRGYAFQDGSLLRAARVVVSAGAE